MDAHGDTETWVTSPPLTLPRKSRNAHFERVHRQLFPPQKCRQKPVSMPSMEFGDKHDVIDAHVFNTPRPLLRTSPSLGSVAHLDVLDVHTSPRDHAETVAENDHDQNEQEFKYQFRPLNNYAIDYAQQIDRDEQSVVDSPFPEVQQAWSPFDTADDNTDRVYWSNSPQTPSRH